MVIYYLPLVLLRRGFSFIIMTKDCEVCHKPFQLKPGTFNRRFTCSKNCQKERYKYSQLGSNNPNYRNAKIKNYICIVCGSPFSKESYSRSPLKTCSKDCYLKNISNIHKGKKIPIDVIERQKLSRRNKLDKAKIDRRDRMYKCSCGGKKDYKASICINCYHLKIGRKNECVVCGKITSKSKRVTTCSPECASKKKQILYTGPKNPNWKGGCKPEHQRIRNHISYKEWRTAVFTRDHFTCQDCGKRNCYLHAHHIKEFSKFPELRTTVENGKTLCVECHKKYHPSMNVKSYKPQKRA